MSAYTVIGGGPVGCAAALQLAQRGHSVTIYEGRDSIPTDPEQSYPIGVNPRGLHAIASVAPAVAERVRTEGRVIDAWQIYAGARCVAKQLSGVVYGTSRGNVNLHLMNAALAHERITVHMNHKLRHMDVGTKRLEFEVRDIGIVTIDASSARIVAADGVNSKVRAALVAADPSFGVTITPWANEYRVLFGAVGKMTDALDPAVHYIFSGGYTATIDNSGQQQWSLVTCVRDTDAATSPSQLVLSQDASPENIARLKAWVQSFAPAFLPLVPEDEFTKYFERRTYRGAVVACENLQRNEWVVLLGDAAHSVLPPTGEGINSGLEDTLVLGACVEASPSAPFALYETRRLPDVRALLAYATHLNTAPSWAGERVARGIFLVLEASTSRSIGKCLFGPFGVERAPYRDIVGTWQWKRLVLLNVARLLSYPIAAVISALLVVPRLVRGQLFVTRRPEAAKPLQSIV
ncbi:hypothetical protein SPRG_06870 [Saprolegnia parasitica CBS 223.65]|uniref:FAD-binding domain-containing protein n=1 Tax=Saprolegnia parasitica (strain CBS 223.65) TaxID=695850 RepID=A0A067CLB9_SAPPC|nr:hypothetical protein SPRG_06870 [Saprolegnia parasitica CBS 223.65]KDO27602.1 hypothetical protein SPRG_06870 [Saprolegnia parasitica CBS 223.65]|eukprot:XP_012201724.1 hypothetical protein SPRG_06870 [Saprolegnia parasitica CBS 223.65]